jgi:hypothetical protein
MVFNRIHLAAQPQCWTQKLGSLPINYSMRYQTEMDV